MKLLHKGTVKDHTLKFDNPEAFTVAKTLLEGKRFELTLEKEKVTRTDSQNKFYWSVVIAVLANHFGYEPEEMHEALKFQFLRTHDDKLPSVKSTTKLTTVEFVDYIDRIMRWAASEHGCYIPSANEEEL